MKFEDLKLPQFDLAFDRCEDRDRVARAVYDQMCEHYEAKLAEANKCPQELLEYVQQFFKVAQQGREAGERLRAAIGRDKPENLRPRLSEQTQKEIERLWPEVAAAICEACGWQKPAPEWRLPDPPPGQQWHRTDWTQDMLPEGYRPLLLGEPWVKGDEIMRVSGQSWHVAGAWRHDLLNDGAEKDSARLRTRRPLPAPVEYVPLEPSDIQPGSVVRCIGATWWKQVTGVRAENVTVCAAGNLSWQTLADGWEIRRPGSPTWEPCKKPKA